MKIKVTEEMREKILTERKEGKLLREIAEKVGLSRAYVNRICLDAGLKDRKWERRTLPQDKLENRLYALSRLLLQGTSDPLIMRVGILIEEMIYADGGGSFYSDGHVGIRFSPTEIEISDIHTGAVASLQLRFKN